MMPPKVMRPARTFVKPVRSWEVIPVTPRTGRIAAIKVTIPAMAVVSIQSSLYYFARPHIGELWTSHCLYTPLE